jgi:beta-N-acetylhexosaminidase
LLINEIKEIIGDDTIIAVDQEGGRVRRLSEQEWKSYASQNVLGKLPSEISKMHATLIAKDLKEVGINLNYAPVLDKIYSQTHEVLRSRCFANNEIELARVMIEAYCDNGVCPCIKHLPGHGRAKVDPHLGLPIIDCSMKDFEQDMAIFKANNIAPAGMTAHIVLPEVDDKPITMSSKAIKEIVRGYIGFDGLLISDAIDMNALSGTICERALQSLFAGCDLVCYCGGKIEDLNNLFEELPQISESAEQRLQKVRDIVKKSATGEVDYEQYQQAIGSVEVYNESYDATEVLNFMNR